MRWMTAKNSPSNSKTMRFPTRRTEVRRRPSSSETLGSKVLNSEGVRMRTVSTTCPRTRCSSARTYAVISGSSGTGSLSGNEDLAQI